LPEEVVNLAPIQCVLALREVYEKVGLLSNDLQEGELI
jgi:hypothetical protein